jgi:hypothetical protein
MAHTFTDRFVARIRHVCSRSGMMSLLRTRSAMLKMPTQTGNARPTGSLRIGMKNITNAMP